MIKLIFSKKKKNKKKEKKKIIKKKKYSGYKIFKKNIKKKLSKEYTNICNKNKHITKIKSDLFSLLKIIDIFLKKTNIISI